MSDYTPGGRVNENDSAENSYKDVIPLGSYKTDDNSARGKTYRCWGLAFVTVVGLTALVVGLVLAFKEEPSTPDDPSITPQEKLEQMMQNAPNAGSKEQAMWNRMTAMNYTVFSEYWKQVDMWDTSHGEVVYEEWEDDAAKYFGMRYNGTNSNNLHGVVRIEQSDGSVDEGTWYGLTKYLSEDVNPGRNGLRRLIQGNKVTVELWKFGEIEFQMEFDENFVETARMNFNGDDDLMNEMFAYRFSKERDDAMILIAMLESKPLLDFDDTLLWMKMHPLSLLLLQTYWNKTDVEQTEPMLDWSQVAYSEWTSIDENGDRSRNYGARHLTSGVAAGVVRRVNAQDKMLLEGSYDLDGNPSGLTREIYSIDGKKYVSVELWLDESDEYFEFDAFFKETARSPDEEELISDLTPETFKVPDYQVMNTFFAMKPSPTNGDCQVDENALAVWESQKPLTVEQLFSWWAKIDMTDPIIDSNQTVFDQWQETEGQQVLSFVGMKDISSNQHNGLARICKQTKEMSLDWTIREGYTNLNYSLLGLQREIMFDGTTQILLYWGSSDHEHTELLAKMHFDENFVEFTDDRVDEQGFFVNVTPEDFRKTDISELENELILN